MNFDYSEEQQLLSESVRRLLARDYGFEARKRIVASPEGSSPQVWAALAELGVLGLALPAEHGGFGGGAVDLLGVMEAFGDALVVEPWLPTLIGARLLAGSPQAAAILPSVIEGKTKLAFAHAEKGARYDLAAVRTIARNAGGKWSLHGEKLAVLGAPGASKLVVSARVGNEIALFLASATRATPYQTLDEMRAADLVFDEAPAEKLPGGLAEIEAAVDFATALICAEAVGAMQYACDATLEYLKTRRQFGVPIGSFQALQHRMVDMVIELEQARSMACLACSRIDQARDVRERQRAVSAAKIRVADAARRVSQESVQLHGGMGMTEEMKISHTFRRLTVIAGQFGDADHHLARFAALS